MSFRRIVSAGGEHSSQTDGIEKAILLGMHQSKFFRIMIVMTAHVQKPVECVENQLTKTVMAVLPRSSFRFIHTDRDVHIDRILGGGHRKREDIGGRLVVHPSTVQKRHLSIVDDLDRTTNTGTIKSLHESAQCIHDEFDLVLVQKTGRVENFDHVGSNLRVGVSPWRLPGFGRLGFGGVASGGLLSVIHVGGWHHGWITSIDGKAASATHSRGDDQRDSSSIR